jgi:serine/threonine protein kinase
VAIKILPEALANDPHFRERLDREARAISQVDHPNICTLFDIGEQDGAAFLVMQYLEGETLQERLSKGALPLEQVLKVATEIASALDQAHRVGIIHRDLKPGNIMLTKTGAKLLDFGLARAAAPAAAGAGLSMLPTTPANLTVQGTILGTFQYMAPEQLEGQEADARTDIFAFGAVVYEMLTGKKAFAGKSQATLIAAIINGQPAPVSQLRPLTPQALEQLVATCLAKEPDERFHSAHDLLLQLRWIAAGGSQAGVPAPIAARRKIRERVLWTLAAVSTLAAMSLALAMMNRPTKQEETTRFTIDAPPSPNLSINVAVSPDGRRLAFVGNTGIGRTGLWIRPLNRIAAQAVSGTEGAYLPFWSPDSRSLGFFADGKLKRIDVSGGPPRTLSDVSVGYGGTWNRQGVILFAPQIGGAIYRVSDSGGVPTPVTTPDSSRGETGHTFPSFLPDGRHFLYLAGASPVTQRSVHVGTVDSKETRHLLTGNSPAIYVSPGYLLFVREGALIGQAFDAKRLTFTGEPVPVAERVGTYSATGAAFFSASDAGVLAYQGGAPVDSQLVWFDRTGKRIGTLGDRGDYSSPVLSPDGTRVAVARRDPQTQTRDIWMLDLKRGTSSRLTFDPADDLNPVWSSGGRQIFFTSERKGFRDIYQKVVSGADAEAVVFESKATKSLDDVSADGHYILYDTGPSGGTTGLWVWHPARDGKPFPFLQTTFSARQGQLSPDGRWIAYSANESGSYDVYVQTFPERRGKWQISTTGGAEPTWRRDGNELFYIADNKIMAVEVKGSSDQFEPGIPKALFEISRADTVARNRYTVTADGQRFLVNTPAENGTPSAITVVVNWAAEIKK